MDRILNYFGDTASSSRRRNLAPDNTIYTDFLQK